jgi:cytochrome c551/c552
VFQPVLQLFGPFLVEFAQVYATAEPSLAPLLAQVEALENEGFWCRIPPPHAWWTSKGCSYRHALAEPVGPSRG